MAGKFVTFVNPGYSALFTRDYSYGTPVANVDGSTTANVFDPDATHPLQEGEWLTMDGATGKVKRACENIAYTLATPAALSVNTSSGTEDVSQAACFMYFAERGRYDAQVTKKAHCIIGPAAMQIRTKMIVCAAGEEGEKVFVTCCIDSSGRHVSALASATKAATASTLNTGCWYAGEILQVHGQNDATILFSPGYL
jgi:hypothetical protein